MVKSESDLLGKSHEIDEQISEFFSERFEYYKTQESNQINKLQNIFDFYEDTKHVNSELMGRMRFMALDVYQSIYEGFYSEKIKPVNLENIERYEVKSMREYNELYDSKKHEMYGIIYKFTLKDSGLKRIGKTGNFPGRISGYLSKARTHKSDSNKLNNFHRALQEALQLLEKEVKDAPIEQLQKEMFKYFKIEIYITKNAIDYNGFEDLLTLYENRAENANYHDLNVNNKFNPIIGDLYEYKEFLSKLGIKDLLLILEECFEMGLTQGEALEYFKEKTENDLISKDELKSLNEKCKKMFSAKYYLAMKSYIIDKCSNIMSKDDMKLIYLIKNFNFLNHEDQKEVIFTTRDGENNPILLMYGTETGFGLIKSFIENKEDFKILWGLETPYQVAQLSYEIIKDNTYGYDEETGFIIYRFKYLNNIEYLGVKINENGNIIELKPYNIDNAEEFFINSKILNIKVIEQI